MAELVQFQTEFANEQVDDLRERLRRTRWPERETVDDWSQGVPLAYLQDLCRYWADGYDFDAAAARLNVHPQFRVGIDGLDIHFLHARSPHEGALPLVLTHGWPGSSYMLVVPNYDRYPTSQAWRTTLNRPRLYSSKPSQCFSR